VPIACRLPRSGGLARGGDGIVCAVLAPVFNAALAHTPAPSVRLMTNSVVNRTLTDLG